ncbi:hypothetical protein OG871_27750 [Kitasatospora sp. NBC_00374]|uniref:hypothetical protein n=1 Tax=Kitasatospora sp. NBC_00374 TaxID=2975964 RepID=UPI0030E1639F
MSGRKLSTELTSAAKALQEAVKALKAAGLTPIEMLEALREPLAAVDSTLTDMRKLRREAVVGAYPDRTRTVYELSEASGLESALITRYAKEAGLELRNRKRG